MAKIIAIMNEKTHIPRSIKVAEAVLYVEYCYEEPEELCRGS